MSESIVIRENIPEYMEQLRSWLTEIQDKPLEQMEDFFARRVGNYEEHMALWREAYRLLTRLIPEQAKTLLDLGCGTGLELDEILACRPGLAVTGIDLTREMLERLREKHPQVRTVCGDYFQEDLGQEVYDCAISFESLHHFSPERKQGLFERLFRALKPGGVYLQVDYLACCQEEESLLMEFCREKRQAQGILEDVFVHFDTPLTLEHEMTLLENAGFSQVEFLACVEGASILRCRRGQL